jgi:choice-of-anchor B domain-containing protein
MIKKRTYEIDKFKIWIIIFTVGMSLTSIHATDDNSFQLTLLGHYEIPEATFITDVWGYFDKNTNREYALITDNFLGLFIVDVSDPTNPLLASQVNTVAGFDVKAWQNYVYTVTGGSLGNGSIIDITNPTKPAVVGTFPSSHNIFIDEQGYMYSEAPGLRIFDVKSNPINPQLLWNRNSNQGHDAAVVDNELYDFHGSLGTYIYDITNRLNPELQTIITDPSISYHHSGWVNSSKEFLFICDELARHPAADISVWDISNFNNPERVGQYADPNATVHNFMIRGNYGYASYYSAGFRVFDVSDPTQICLVAEYDTSPAHVGEGFTGAFGVYPFANSENIYVSDWDNGLFIFSFNENNGPPLTENPTEFLLKQNHPNPFNQTTTFVYEIPSSVFVEIIIYNMLGQKIKTFVRENKSQGSYPVVWTGTDDSGNRVSSGIYFYRMTAGNFVNVKKLVFLN